MIGPGTLSALLASMREAQKATLECDVILIGLRRIVDAKQYAVAKMHVENAEESLRNLRKAIGVIANEHD